MEILEVHYFCYEYGWGNNTFWAKSINLDSQDIKQSLIDLENGRKLSEVVKEFVPNDCCGKEIFNLRFAKFGQRYECYFKGDILKGDFRQVGRLLVPSYHVVDRNFIVQEKERAEKSGEEGTVFEKLLRENSNEQFYRIFFQNYDIPLDLEKVLVLSKEQLE